MANQSQYSIIPEFIKTYDQYSDKIFRHVYFRTGDREKAFDLMQETFTKTFLYIKGGAKIENIQAFLYKVANNLMIDEAKKHQKYKLVSLEQLEEDGFMPGVDDSDDIKQKIDAETVLSKLGQIPTQYQQVIVLRYVDELSPKEIARILGESENSVRVKIHRSLKQLRKIIENHE